MKRLALIIASALLLVSCAANKGITVKDDRGTFIVPLTEPSYSYTLEGNNSANQSGAVTVQSGSCNAFRTPEEGKNSVTASPVSDIIIDGMKSETFATEPVTITGGAGNSVIHLGTGSGGLYIFAEVSDKTPGININDGKKIKNGDAIEIFFSNNGGADPKRTNMDANDYWIILKASENPDGYNYRLDAPLDRAQYFYKKTNTGYVLEALIPWHNFQVGCLCSIKNRLLGFEAAVIDAKNNSLPVKIYPWSKKDDYRVNPSRWGYITVKL